MGPTYLIVISPESVSISLKTDKQTEIKNAENENFYNTARLSLAVLYKNLVSMGFIYLFIYLFIYFLPSFILFKHRYHIMRRMFFPTGDTATKLSAYSSKIAFHMCHFVCYRVLYWDLFIID